MVSLPSEFRTALESYNGPLDLLLYLVKRDEVDVFDIPIAEVVAQYQSYLAILQEIDPNACGDFLVMAARLMEIKSKLLLPREELEEEGELEDPRVELVRQLLEYKKFKERALLLEKRLQEHSRRYRRPHARRPEWDVAGDQPADIGDVSVWDLLTAFHRVQISLGYRGPHQVVLEDRPLEDYIREVMEILERSADRGAGFESLFVHARCRSEALGYFVAILQLAKDYRIVLRQEAPGTEIQLRLREEEERRRLVEAVQNVASTPSAAEFLEAGEGMEAVREPIDPDENDGDSDSDSDPDSVPAAAADAGADSAPPAAPAAGAEDPANAPRRSPAPRGEG